MLTGFESLLRTLATVLVVLLGWLPVGSILSSDGPFGSAISDAFSGVVIAVGGVAESESVESLDGPRAVSGDGETLDDAPAAEGNDESIGNEETVGSGDPPADDVEGLDDAGRADVGGTLPEPAMDAAGSDVETLDDADPVFDDFEDLDDLFLPDAIDELAELGDANAGSDVTGAADTSGGGGGGGGGGGRNGSGGRTAAGAADVNCADFPSQAEAQTYFDNNGGTVDNNVAGLDANANGQACEDFDYGQAVSGGGGGNGAAAPESGGGGRNGGGGGGGRTASGDGGGEASTEAPGGNGGGGSDGGNGAAVIAPVDVSSCRTVASSNGNVAATGCDSVARANVAVSGGGGVRAGGSESVGERGADVRTSRVIARSAVAGTEIEIDRGGDENGEGERLRSRRPAADRSASRQQRVAAPNEEAVSAESVTATDAERGDDPVLRWLPEVKAASHRTGVSKEQIAAVMRVTSGGDPEVRFPDGAVGLMKVPAEAFVARGIAEDRRTDPGTNVGVGAEILAERLAALGAIEPALSEYVGDDAAPAALDWIEHYRSIMNNSKDRKVEPRDGLSRREVDTEARPTRPAIEDAAVGPTSLADADADRPSRTIRHREATERTDMTGDAVVPSEAAAAGPTDQETTVTVSAAGGDRVKSDADRKAQRRDPLTKDREEKDRRSLLSLGRTDATAKADDESPGQGRGKREKKR